VRWPTDRSALEGDLRSERFGTALIQSAFSGTWLADALSEIGRFDQAIGHAEAIAEEADHPYTLSTGLIALGLTHLRCGDLPRATRVLERGLDLSHTWQIKALYFVAATLGVAYALAGQADEALQLIAGPLPPRRVPPAPDLLPAGACSSVRGEDLPLSCADQGGGQPRPRGPGAHPAAGGPGKRGSRPLPHR
jgi:hypothetical protein